jgi:hypothetical protein
MAVRGPGWHPSSPRMPRDVDVLGHGRWLGVARLTGITVAVVALGACAGRGSGGPGRVRMAHADRVAYGRPATCPDNAVDVFGDGRPGPDDLRCSYSDTAGGELVRLGGRVQRPTVGATLGEGLQGVTVLVQEIEPSGATGRVVARAITDAQGTFSLGVVLPAGEYLVVVPGAGAGPPRASRRFEIGHGQKQMNRLDLFLDATPSDAPATPP